MTTTFHGSVSNNTVDLELRVFRDTDQSQHDFDDTMHMYSYSGYHTTARAFYKGYDGSDSDVPVLIADCYDLSDVTRKEARAFVVDVLKDGNWVTVRDIVSECKQYYDGNWKDYLSDVLEDHYKISDMFDDEERPDIGKFKYDVVSVRGYSQGDYAEVMFDASRWNGDSSAAQRHFERLFYDSPVYARLEVDGEEYYLDELMEDVYEWDRDEIIKIIEEKWSDLDINVRNWVYINLPEYPEYI